MINESQDDNTQSFEMLKDENHDLEKHNEKLVFEVSLLRNTLKERNETIDALEDQMQKHEIFQDMEQLRGSYSALQGEMEKETRSSLDRENALLQQKKELKR